MGAPPTLPADFSGWDKAPQTLPADFDKWDDHANAKSDAKPDRFAQDMKTTQAWAEGHPILGPIARFLVSGGQNAANAITDTPGALYHAIVDPPTMDEAGLTHEQRLAYRLGGKQALEAGQDYASGKVTPAGAASVLPEALGTGVGQVAGGSVYGKAGKVAPELASVASDVPISKVTAPVRAAVRGANTVLRKAPGLVGASAGSAMGHATGIPGAAEIGGAAGYALGKEVLPQLRVPGEGFGLPSRVAGGPEAAPPYKPAAPTPYDSVDALRGKLANRESGIDARPGADETGPPAPRTVVVDPQTGKPEFSDVVESRSQNLDMPREVSGESALRKILQSQENSNLIKIARSRGVDVTSEAQLKAGVANPKIIDKIMNDFSDDELDNVRSTWIETHRNPRDFASVERAYKAQGLSGQDLADKMQEFWNTKAIQTYFPDVKIPVATMKRVQTAASIKDPVPTSSEDLIGQMQESIRQLAAKKKAAH